MHVSLFVFVKLRVREDILKKMKIDKKFDINNYGSVNDWNKIDPQRRSI
jgi:hypothetical protein